MSRDYTFVSRAAASARWSTRLRGVELTPILAALATKFTLIRNECANSRHDKHDKRAVKYIESLTALLQHFVIDERCQKICCARASVPTAASIFLLGCDIVAPST